jgi:predicted RNA-binding Zn-ribbon protein involved in translation (DUF1610 family)
MKLTGAAILVSRGMKFLQAAPAAYPYRSANGGAVNRKALKDLVHSTPPRCLRRFRATQVRLPAAWGQGVAMRWDVGVAWEVACPCGSREGVVLGHPLTALNPGLAGEKLFVSPFAFKCGGCGKATKLLDTDTDGTAAELARLDGDDDGCAAYRGAGRKQPFPCPECGTSLGAVTVALFFTADYVDYLEEDGIRFPFENLFSGVRIYYRCSGCRKQAMVTDIDTKY